MEFEWDENKRKINLQKHNVDFEDAKQFFELPCLVKEDGRFDYGEIRYVAMGLVNQREMVMVFTRPRKEVVRVISFRKANTREARKYYEYIKNEMAAH